MTPETRRQLIHLGVGAFALPVPFLGARWAVALAAFAVFVNWVVFPLTGKDADLLREGESFFNGVRFYPVAVLIAMLALPLTLAQGAWAILATGDCFSNLIGRRYGRAKLPWNRPKSWAGTLGFLATAFPAAFLLMLFTQRFAGSQAFWSFWSGRPEIGPFETSALAMIALLGSLAGAIAESLPLKLDDNLSVTFASGAVMACAAGAF